MLDLGKNAAAAGLNNSQLGAICGDADVASKLKYGSLEFSRAAFALAIGSFTTFAVLHSPQPILPQLAEQFSLTPSLASLSMSAGTAGIAFALIPMAVAADRFGRELLIFLGILGSAIASILSAISADYDHLVISRVLVGFFAACVPAAAMAYLGDEISIESRGKAIGLCIAGNALGGMSGRLVSAIFTSWMGWRFSLGVIGLIGLMGAFVFYKLIPPARFFKHSEISFWQLFSEIKKIYSNKAFPRLFTIGFLLMGSFVALYNYLCFRLSDSPYNLGPTAIGLIFLIYAIGSFSSAKSGGLADAYGHRRIALLFAAVMLCGVIVTLADSLVLVVLGLSIFTVGYFGVFAVGNAWIGHLATTRKALVSSLFFSSSYLGSSTMGTALGLPWTAYGWVGVTLTLGAAIVCITGIVISLKD